MVKKYISITITTIFLSVLLFGCTPSKFFKYDTNEIVKIELYSTDEIDFQLNLEITDKSKIETILKKLNNIAYTRYYDDIKAKSDYIIRVYFDENTYDDIEPYRIIKYKDGKLEENLKYSCSVESFQTLYNFALA